MKLATKVGIFTVRSGAPALLLALAVTQVCAQEPPPMVGDGFPPPPDGEGQFGGPGGPPPMGGQRMATNLSAAIVPASAMVAYLNLSEDKSRRLLGIIEELRTNRPHPGGGQQAASSSDGPRPLPTREEMAAARPKFDAAISKANRDIAALLDARQNKRLPVLLKAFKALQSDGISLNAAARLRLSETQIDSLAALGASPGRAAVTASFTAEQREIAELNRTIIRRGPPGGRPGFGPPPDGGPGFGPPPDGGPGGPPDGPPD